MSTVVIFKKNLLIQKLQKKIWKKMSKKMLKKMSKKMSKIETPTCNARQKRCILGLVTLLNFPNPVKNKIFSFFFKFSFVSKVLYYRIASEL